MSEAEAAGTGPQPGQAAGTGEESRYEAGLALRRAMLGDEYVNQALGQATPFDADFQRFVTEVAWGSVWARPGLERSTRSLVTIAILAALGRTDELALHLRASRNAGVQPEQLAEALFHVAVYAGVPAARTAFLMAKPLVAASGSEWADDGSAPTQAEKSAGEDLGAKPGTL